MCSEAFSVLGISQSWDFGGWSTQHCTLGRGETGCLIKSANRLKKTYSRKIQSDLCVALITNVVADDSDDDDDYSFRGYQVRLKYHILMVQLSSQAGDEARGSQTPKGPRTGTQGEPTCWSRPSVGRRPPRPSVRPSVVLPVRPSVPARS
jgi:hypothetical protein